MVTTISDIYSFLYCVLWWTHFCDFPIYLDKNIHYLLTQEPQASFITFCLKILHSLQALMSFIHPRDSGGEKVASLQHFLAVCMSESPFQHLQTTVSASLEFSRSVVQNP